MARRLRCSGLEGLASMVADTSSCISAGVLGSFFTLLPLIDSLSMDIRDVTEALLVRPLFEPVTAEDATLPPLPLLP